jgi:DNA repair exonuclease SbcCD ATPase subunit
MTLKRWVLWLCIIALLISELLLISANQQKTKAIAEAHDAQEHLLQMSNDVVAGRSTSAQAQTAENARLRSENQDLPRLRNQVHQLEAANEKLAQELKDARTLIQQQQAALQEWQAASQQAEQQALPVQTSAPAATPRPAAAGNPATAAAQRRACINNLNRIYAAKQQWALENNKPDDAVPTVADLLPYFKDGVFPSCPAGGLYSINAVSVPPTCSIPGHVLTQ